MKSISLKSDYAFRALFAHEGVRKRFISDVTGIPLESILYTRLDNPFLLRHRRRQKQGILDVAVRLHDGTKIDIEMQIRFQKHWTKRNLFYLAKMYSDTLWAGEDYGRLKKCITISILDFVLMEDDVCHSVYTLRDRRGREFSDLFEVHIIELPKPSGDAGAVGEWIQLFNVESREELDMIRTENAGILEAREIMRRLILKNPLRQMYEQHLKEVRDRKAEDAYVRDLGKAEGETLKLIDLVCRKMVKGKTIEEIAEALEEDVKEVACIYHVAVGFAPNYDREKILQELKKTLAFPRPMW
ncbi:MAG: Rpn family recombination-promoting nuclease/putative transposase [Acetatifactor sp.]|nr:Rpn family recombination-promoting nuclease/putative transposase [Acetatifactor sp.]